MQIKIIISSHLTPSRMAIFKRGSKCWRGGGGCSKDEKACTLLMRIQADAPTMENSIEIPQKKFKKK